MKMVHILKSIFQQLNKVNQLKIEIEKERIDGSKKCPLTQQLKGLEANT